MKHIYLVLILVLLALTFNPTHLASAIAGESSSGILDKDPNLAAWWKLDETSGETASDSSGHKHKGTARGGLSFETNSAPGKAGKALKFDGEDNYIEVTGYKGIAGTRPRTVTAWIKTASSKGDIISWGTDDYGKMFILGFIRGRVGVRPNGGYLYMNDPVHDDEWHHVAVVVEEAELPNLYDNVKLYKDGMPAVIHDIGLLDLWPIDTGNELDVSIGRKFKGLIDDIRIYDRPLSEDEMKVLFALQSDRLTPKAQK